MKSTQPDEMSILYNALLPALSRAAVGDFDGEIEAKPEYPRRVNEILMGVEVLLEVIREQQAQPRSEQVELLDNLLSEPASPAPRRSRLMPER